MDALLQLAETIPQICKMFTASNAADIPLFVARRRFRKRADDHPILP